MISFFKSMLSNESIVEGAQKGIDAAFLTNEEKTQYFLEYLKASMPMNVARRFIALAITLFWVFVGVIQVVLILSSSPLIEEMHSFAIVYAMPPFTVLVSFYFWRRMEKGK